MTPSTYLKNISLWSLLRTEWKWLLIGSVFSLLFANILLRGWPLGLIPQLSHPYVYGNDAIFMSWEVQRLIEGWLFDNSRSGYPFGSSFLDYPHSDNGSLLILKLFGLITGTFYGALNLYLLAGFVAVFLVSYLVFKFFCFRSVYAFTAALLFSFAPFHFGRMMGGHFFYTCYFVVPIFFFYGWKIFFDSSSIWPRTIKKTLVLLGIFIALSSFGVYFAFFGVLTLIICGIAAAIKQNKMHGFLSSLILASLVVLGVGLNLLPNLINKYENGPNIEAGGRLVSETETYALKPAQLFFPYSNHRINQLRRPVQAYSHRFQVTESIFCSSLGFLAALGMVSLLLCLFAASLGKQIDIRLGLLAVLVISYIFISTVGGLNVFFALYISPLIRGWNRISIFISFAALTALFLLLQENKNLEALYEKNKLIFYSIAFFLLGIGLLDQTPSSLIEQTQLSKNRFINNQTFTKEIETLLPIGSAIYQLPYMGFPEYGNYINLTDYELLTGFLNSKTLRWSHAGIKGREGDLFYRYLAKEPLAKQLEVIKRLGFSGIYIDRRGFADQAADLQNQLNSLLGSQPTLVSKDNQQLFYRISPAANLVLSSLNSSQIMEQAGYRVTKEGPVYEATLEEGFDFTRPGLPSFIENIRGLSGVESWGRWSDARMAPTVRFDFTKPLPNDFNLVVSLSPFGPNAGKKMKLVVGRQIYYLSLGTAGPSESTLAIELKGEKATSIEFFPPVPSSPIGDPRKLAVGFLRLQIEPKTV